MSHPDQWSWVEWNTRQHGAQHAVPTAAPAPTAPRPGGVTQPPPGMAAARALSTDSNVSHMQRVSALRSGGAPPAQHAAAASAPAPGKDAARTVRPMQAIDEETEVVMGSGSNTLLYVFIGLLVVLLIVYAYLAYRTRKRNADNEKAVKAAQAAANSRSANPPDLPAAQPQQPNAADSSLNALRGASQSGSGGRVLLHTPGAAQAPPPGADTAPAAAPPAATPQAPTPHTTEANNAAQLEQMLPYAHKVAHAVIGYTAGDADTALHDSVKTALPQLGTMNAQTLAMWIRKHEEVAHALSIRQAQVHAAQQQAHALQADSHARVTALEEVPDAAEPEAGVAESKSPAVEEGDVADGTSVDDVE